MEKLPFRITAARQGDRATVRITGKIGWDTDSNAFRAECDKLLNAGVRDVHLYINTPGGSVFDANEIVNILNGFPGAKTGEGGALVASAGTYIAMHCDTFTLPANGRMMIHKPSGATCGDSCEIKNYATVLESLEKEYLEAYLKKASNPEEFKSKWESGDYWLTAQEALAAGFITSIKEKITIDKESAMMIACYNSVPIVPIVPIVPNVPKIENQNSLNPLNQKNMDFLKMIVAATGLSDSASESEALKHVVQLSDKNRSLSDTNKLLTEERNKLKADFEALQAQTAASEKNVLLTAAEKEKRITAKERETFSKLDIDDVKALLSDRKAPVNPMSFISTLAAPEGSEKWSFADWSKNDPEGLSSLKAGDPATYKQLFKAQYGVDPAIS
jgi:ATP-dependent protease ClpP protease subunit